MSSDSLNDSGDTSHSSVCHILTRFHRTMNRPTLCCFETDLEEKVIDAYPPAVSVVVSKLAYLPIWSLKKR